MSRFSQEDLDIIVRAGPPVDDDGVLLKNKDVDREIGVEPKCYLQSF